MTAVAPDADHQVHRHQHHFPEQVEEEEIDREQSAEQPGLEQQHHEAEFARTDLDIAAAGVEQRQRDEQGRQEYEEEADTVDPDVVGDAELGNPRIALDELIGRLLRIENREEIKADRERDEREDEGGAPDRLLVALQENAERAKGRHEDQKR